MSYLVGHFDRCSGCSICQLVCSERLLGGYNPHRAVLRVDHQRENLYHFPVVCHQCGNAYCLNVCPTGAISLEERTGAKVIDPDKCIGCGTCARYCPLGVIRIDPESRKSLKCDLCGGDPLCVKACPAGALELVATLSGAAVPEGGNNA
jgi:Fe-S-cluster-containing hydrogenase component 2